MSAGVFFFFFLFFEERMVNLPTMPNRAVKMTSRAMLAKLEMDVAQPRSRAAAAGLGHVESVMKAGVEALK